MKPIITTVGFLLTLLAGTTFSAQKIYTWTDENGVVHLSDQPPPKTDNANDIEVIKYDEKTPQEIKAIEQKKENLRRKFDKQEQIEKARQAATQARKAEERAQEAVKKAQEGYEYNNKYIRRLTSTKNKRKKFRKRVERIIKETEVSRAEAQAAIDQAEKAAQEARRAAEEAQME